MHSSAFPAHSQFHGELNVEAGAKYLFSLVPQICLSHLLWRYLHADLKGMLILPCTLLMATMWPCLLLIMEGRSASKGQKRSIQTTVLPLLLSRIKAFRAFRDAEGNYKIPLQCRVGRVLGMPLTDTVSSWDVHLGGDSLCQRLHKGCSGGSDLLQGGQQDLLFLPPEHLPISCS